MKGRWSVVITRLGHPSMNSWDLRRHHATATTSPSMGGYPALEGVRCWLLYKAKCQPALQQRGMLTDEHEQ